jgi:hypothetical protein
MRVKSWDLSVFPLLFLHFFFFYELSEGLDLSKEKISIFYIFYTNDLTV